MKTLLLMAAVLMTAAQKDSEPAPSGYQMCMMVCRGLPGFDRYLCELNCFIATRGGLPDKSAVKTTN